MAKKRKKKIIEGKSARLNLMIDPRLKEWAHKYAKRRSTSISAVITGHLSDLREQERGDGVKQI